jgi:hypothetical protein
MPLTHCIGGVLVDDDSLPMWRGPGRIRLSRYDGERERQGSDEKHQQVAPCHSPAEGGACRNVSIKVDRRHDNIPAKIVLM